MPLAFRRSQSFLFIFVTRVPAVLFHALLHVFPAGNLVCASTQLGDWGRVRYESPR